MKDTFKENGSKAVNEAMRKLVRVRRCEVNKNKTWVK